MQMTLKMRTKIGLYHSTSTSEFRNHWYSLKPTAIYGITTVPYCKSTEHLVYRAAVPHGVELLDFTLLHWTALYPAVRHCTGY